VIFRAKKQLKVSQKKAKNPGFESSGRRTKRKKAKNEC